jgi:hypothetical protein
MTAIEWLEDTIDEKHMGEFLKSVIEYAKHMEKQQIIEAFEEGNRYKFASAGEKYYNNTFKK